MHETQRLSGVTGKEDWHMKKLLIAAFALTTTPALAHHPLAGAPMETFTHGVLSGVGHPILGFDHLFFIVAVGIVAMFTGRALTAPLGYVAGMLAGCFLIMGGIALPAVELVIAASLIVAGGILMTGRGLGLKMCIALFGALGLFHGWAFGQSITGQEGSLGSAVVLGYLMGLAVIQWAVAAGAGWAISRLGAAAADAMPARLAGGLVAGAGLFLVLEAAEGAAFSALGLG
ncbi:MAG: HupE/UreJ family protein [Paracoccaceae bacterium]